MRLRFLWLAALILPSVLITASEAVEHPFHSSLAEMEWNPKSASFEVALSVWPVDLENVLRESEDLTKRLNGPLSLDDKSQHKILDASIKAYVQKHFRLADEKLKVEMNWLGFEVEKDSVWCYFEISDFPDKALAAANGKKVSVEFENRLFFELQPDQQNTILFKQAGKRTAIHFVSRHPIQTLDFDPTAN